MPNVVITCPSGLQGEIRNLKGREVNMLADKAALKSGTAFDSVLANCWLRTDNPGVYTIPPGGNPSWPDAYLCDRFYILLQLRSVTFGDDYEFRMRCAYESCEEFFNWSVKLSELKVKPLPEETRAQLKNGTNDFVTKVGGRNVTHRLMTGKGERAGAERLKKMAAGARVGEQGMILASVAIRIESIEGVEKKMPFLEDLDASELQDLREKLEESDGGVTTEIEVRCPHCRSPQEINLPFGKEFWKASKKKATTTPDPEE